MKHLMSLIICIVPFLFQAQITFENIPEDLAFIPRNSLNKGTIIISGNFNSTSFIQMRSTIVNMQNDSVLDEKLIERSIDGNFSYTHTVQAALNEYKMQIFAIGLLKDTLVREVKHLVCGDVFLIGGQSNALDAKAPELSMDSQVGQNVTSDCVLHNRLYSHPYGRAIGYCMEFANEIEQKAGNSGSAINDLAWGNPSCIYWDHGFVGAWALKLQYKLTEAIQIPICIINGAYSGKEIKALLASSAHQENGILDLSKPYDRAYSKLNAKHLANFVKGIFWYQGEADGDLEYSAATNYIRHFLSLYQSWKKDFPNFEQVFLFQANTACGGANMDLIRGLQFKLSNELPDVTIMSTVGSNAQERSSADACHYTLLGSNRIADKTLPVVLNKLYGFDYLYEHIFPPKVKSALYKNASSQISITFDQDIYLQAPLTVSYTTNNNKIVYTEEKLEHYFYNEYGEQLEIQEIVSIGPELIIELNPGFCRPKKVTYLPSTYYHQTNYQDGKVPVYTGPWIMNKSNTIGALTFHNLLLDCENNDFGNMCCNSIKVFPNPSQGEMTLLSADKKPKELRVFNTNGTEVLKMNFENERHEINLTALPIGLYLFQVCSENEVVERVKVILVE